MAKIIINSIPKSGGHLIQALAKKKGYSECRRGVVYLSGNFIGSHVKLFFILMTMTPKQFLSAHFLHTKLAEFILRLFNTKMILVEREFFDVLQSQIDFLKSPKHPYHLLFHHLTELEAARILMSGYAAPIECVHQKSGKRFYEKNHGIKEPLDIVFKKIGKWKSVKSTKVLNYSTLVDDAKAGIFGTELVDFMQTLSQDNVHVTSTYVQQIWDTVYLKPTATLFVGGNNRGRKLREKLQD